MSKLIKVDEEYKEWIHSVSQRFKRSQIKAAIKVNDEMLLASGDNRQLASGENRQFQSE